MLVIAYARSLRPDDRHRFPRGRLSILPLTVAIFTIFVAYGFTVSRDSQILAAGVLPGAISDRLGAFLAIIKPIISAL